MSRLGGAVSTVSGGEKTCSMCKESKHVSLFWRYSGSKDGLQNACKDCMRENRRGVDKRREERVAALADDPTTTSLVPAPCAHLAAKALDRTITDDEAEQLYSWAHYLRELQGLDILTIAAGLGVTERTARNWIAKGRKGNFTPDTREEIRARVLGYLEDLTDDAAKVGDTEGARRALMDIAKLAGLVSTGGNVMNVKMETGNTKELETRIEQWMARQEAIEGEVVDDDEDGDEVEGDAGDAGIRPGAAGDG